MKPDGTGLERRHLDRKTPWRLVKKYCRAAGIDPDRLGGRGIGIHSLRKTAINDAIRNGATMHEVREFAGHADIRCPFGRRAKSVRLMPGWAGGPGAFGRRTVRPGGDTDHGRDEARSLVAGETTGGYWALVAWTRRSSA